MDTSKMNVRSEWRMIYTDTHTHTHVPITIVLSLVLFKPRLNALTTIKHLNDI